MARAVAFHAASAEHRPVCGRALEADLEVGWSHQEFVGLPADRV
jgi:hypothetical protein